MKTLDIIQAMNQNQIRFVTVERLKELTGQTRAAAKMTLSRLNEDGAVTRLKRGLYLNNLAPEVHPYEALPFLTAPNPSYVSLFSILSDNGLVDDMVPPVFAVTTGKSAGYRTELGIYRLYHVKEEMMCGYEKKLYKHGERNVADSEKAFLDLVYLSMTPGRNISLPGNWPEIFRLLDRKKFRMYVDRASSGRLDNFLARAEEKIEDSDESPPAVFGESIKIG
ncbi:MAG: hypothetical protein ACLFN5_03815 [bacterium]